MSNKNNNKLVSDFKEMFLSFEEVYRELQSFMSQKKKSNNVEKIGKLVSATDKFSLSQQIKCLAIISHLEVDDYIAEMTKKIIFRSIANAIYVTSNALRVSREKIEDVSYSDEVLFRLHEIAFKINNDSYLVDILSKGINAYTLTPKSKCVESKNQNYLFISGTPRSGTSALGRLLNTSVDVCLFVEAYNHKFGYRPEMFSLEYFDENVGILHSNINKILFDKLCLGCKYVGDKRPSFMLSIDATLRNFDPNSLKILHVYRDVYDVALSYKRRAYNASEGKDPFWDSNKGILAAVREFNLNNQKVLRCLNNLKITSSIRLCGYSDLFSSEAKFVEILTWLEISDSEKVLEEFRSNMNNFNTRSSGKEELDDMELELINRKIDHIALKEILHRM